MRTFVSYLTNKYFRFSFLRKLIWTFIVFIVFTITLIIILPQRDVKTKPVGWERRVFISPGKIYAKNVSIASKGRFVAVVYEGIEKKKKGIYVSVSFKGGRSFLAPVKITDIFSNMENNPHVAISKRGHITIAWHDFSEGESTNRIYYSLSTDMGASWSNPAQVFLGYDMEMIPRIYYDNKSRLHLFCHAYKGGVFNLYHALSKKGKKFNVIGPLIKITKRIRGAFFPAILFSGRNIYIAWQRRGRDFSDDIFFMRSSNYGDSWTSAVRVTKSKASDSSPSILLHKGIFYLAYRNNSQKNWAIKLLRGYNGGRVWDETPVAISKTNADCYSPRVALSKNKVVVVWYDGREKRSKVFSRTMSLLNKKFTDETKLSLRPYSAKNPKIISVGPMVVVFWQEGGRIFAKHQDVYVAPPVVFSSTHPRGKWKRNSIAQIQWRSPKDNSGIVGYAGLVTKSIKTRQVVDINPTIQNIKGHIRRKVIPELEDGITYFHIRAIDGAGNFSRTIHYPIRVSVNPLPIPVVVSGTHPQGKSGKTNSPEFRWAMDDVVRLKGFLFALSRDTVKQPNRFTTDLKVNFSDLKEGKYFFSLQAVDKTNMKSRIAPYVFFIGKEGKVDPDYIKEISKGKIKKKIPWVPKIPAIDVSFPFDIKKPFEMDSFKAIIQTRYIKDEDVIGYSIYIDRQQRGLPKKVNYKSKILNVEGLVDGEYYIGAMCNYYKTVGKKRRALWTKPYLAKVTIEKISDKSPVAYYSKLLMVKISRNAGVISLIIFGLTLSILTIGFGTRLLYYIKLFQYKFKVVLRLFLW
ncbi:hypothetical protein ACFL20_08840 [Spirochaetota bacterium]